MPDSIAAATFEERINALVAARDGTQAVAEYVHRDPEQRFAAMFNRTMAAVAAQHLEQAYSRPQAALADKVRSGQIATFRQLVGMAEAILVMTAMSLRNKAYHQARRRAAGMGAQAVRAEVSARDLDQFPAERDHPSERLEIEDAGRALRLTIRAMGRLAFQAYRRVCQFELRRGSRHGAFTHVAGMAIFDNAGAIRGFRRTPLLSPASPAPETVRAVTRLVRRAEAYVRA